MEETETGQPGPSNNFEHYRFVATLAVAGFALSFVTVLGVLRLGGVV